MRTYMKEKEVEVSYLRQDNGRLCDIVARLSAQVSAQVDIQTDIDVGPSTKRSQQY